MRIPIILLSYGDFQTSKKLFSYERHGVHSLPIFTDAGPAAHFASEMTKLLHKAGDGRQLQLQICAEPKKALGMFESIAAFCPDLLRVVIDPKPPTRQEDDNGITDLDSLQWVEDVRDIDDVIEQIQDWVSADAELDNDSDSNNL